MTFAVIIIKFKVFTTRACRVYTIQLSLTQLKTYGSVLIFDVAIHTDCVSKSR